MNGSKGILLHFSSNVERYRVRVYDGENVVAKEISARRDCLLVCTRSPCIRVVARSLTSGYATSLYFWLDVTRNRLISLYFNFQPTSAPIALNRFTLTDANYGLPIDGTLLFTR